MVTGVPGSGKSTLVKFLESELKNRGIKFRVVDDYLILRSLCPEGKNDDMYFYDQGAIVIREKYIKQILGDLYKKLSEDWEVDGEGLLILETTNPNLEQFVKEFLISRENTGLIFVNCNIEEAKKRNLNREKDHIIPGFYMDMFGNDHVNFFNKLKVFFDKSGLISNFDVKVEMERQLKKLVTDWFDNGFVVETNRD